MAKVIGHAPRNQTGLDDVHLIHWQRIRRTSCVRDRNLEPTALMKCLSQLSLSGGSQFLGVCRCRLGDAFFCSEDKYGAPPGVLLSYPPDSFRVVHHPIMLYLLILYVLVSQIINCYWFGHLLGATSRGCVAEGTKM